jgi:hypothetical protein
VKGFKKEFCYSKSRSSPPRAVLTSARVGPYYVGTRIYIPPAYVPGTPYGGKASKFSPFGSTLRLDIGSTHVTQPRTRARHPGTGYWVRHPGTGSWYQLAPWVQHMVWHMVHVACWHLWLWHLGTCGFGTRTPWHMVHVGTCGFGTRTPWAFGLTHVTQTPWVFGLGIWIHTGIISPIWVRVSGSGTRVTGSGTQAQAMLRL